MEQAQIQPMQTQAQPVGEQPTSQPVVKKKTNWMMWIIVALVVLLIGGGIWFLFIK